MLKNRIRAAKDITEKLTALEAAIDDALACASDLTISVVTARQETKVSAVVGQDAIGLTGEAIKSLHDARAQMVDAHNAFAVARDQMGLRTFASGGLWKVTGSNAANQQSEIEAVSEQEAA